MTSPTCGQVCASSLREDDRHGLISGPWLVEDDGRVFFTSRRRWAYLTGCCCYCRAELPPRRYAALAREFEREVVA